MTSALVIQGVNLYEVMEKQRRSDSTANGNRTEPQNDDAQQGPGAAFNVFILMEDLIDKMKLLKYEAEFLKEFNIKPLSRCRVYQKIRCSDFII